MFEQRYPECEGYVLNGRVVTEPTLNPAGELIRVVTAGNGAFGCGSLYEYFDKNDGRWRRIPESDIYHSSSGM